MKSRFVAILSVIGLFLMVVLVLGSIPTVSAQQPGATNTPIEPTLVNPPTKSGSAGGSGEDNPLTATPQLPVEQPQPTATLYVPPTAVPEVCVNTKYVDGVGIRVSPGGDYVEGPNNKVRLGESIQVVGTEEFEFMDSTGHVTYVWLKTVDGYYVSSDYLDCNGEEKPIVGPTITPIPTATPIGDVGDVPFSPEPVGQCYVGATRGCWGPDGKVYWAVPYLVNADAVRLDDGVLVTRDFLWGYDLIILQSPEGVFLGSATTWTLTWPFFQNNPSVQVTQFRAWSPSQGYVTTDIFVLGDNSGEYGKPLAKFVVKSVDGPVEEYLFEF